MGGGQSEERIQSEDRLVLWQQLLVSGLEQIRGGMGMELEREGMLDWLVLREIMLLGINWVVQGVSDDLPAYRSIEVVSQRLINV